MVAASDAGLSAGSARQSSQQVLTSLNTMLRQPLSSVGGGAGGAAGGAAPSEAADRRAAAQQQAEKAALDDFLLMHARRYDFSSGDGAADAFGTTFALLVNERFLSAPNWLRMGTADFRLRVLQCMRVLMRDGAHRRAFGRTSGAVARLCDLCVDLTTEHFEPPTLDGYTSEMLVETLSILKRFAHISAPAAAHPVHAPAHNSADTSAEVSAPASAHTSAHASADASVVSSGRPSACASVMGSPASPTGARRPLFDIDGLAHPPAGPPVVSATGAPPPSVSAADRPAGPLPSRTASPAMGRAGRAAPPITKSGEGNAAAFGGGACGEEAVGEGATEPWRLHGALVALLSTREALVLQCVLVAMYQFVQVEHHRVVIASLGCAEILLRILSDYEPSFKVLSAELLELLLRSQPFCREVVMHDGASTLLSLLHADDAALPPPLLRAMWWLAADPPSAKEMRQLGGINVLLSLMAPNAAATPDTVAAACAVLARLATDHDAALQIRKANGVYVLGMQLLAHTTADTPAAPNAAHQTTDTAPTAPATPSATSSAAGPLAHMTAASSRQLGAPPDTPDTGGVGVAAHLFRTLRFVYSMERNRKIFRRLFPPDLFGAFIDVGQYVEDVTAYAPLADRMAAMAPDARAKMAQSLSDINVDRGHGAQQQYVRDYAVQELIGKGGFGSVYQVKGSGETLYAMKELPMEDVADNFEPGGAPDTGGGGPGGKAAVMLEREVGILSSLRHPNIIRYFDSFVEKHSLFIIMELVEGATLLDHITSHQEKGTFLTEQRIWHIFCQTCLALRYCHKTKQVVHRDLTPSNIMIAEDLTVKLADFGLARQRLGTNSVMESVVGSVLYQCPELIQHESYGEKADIWALGCILYQMATLRPPFEGGNPIVVATRIVEAIYDPVPDDRYSSLLRQTIPAMLTVDPADRPDIDDVARLISPVLMAQLEEYSQERMSLAEELRVERDARLQIEREALHAKEVVHRIFARHQLDLAAAGAMGRGAAGGGGASMLASRDASPLRTVRPPRETTRSPMLSISPNRIREIHDPCSRILHQLHKILFIAQLPPTTAAAPERLFIEKYKHALFSRRLHHRGWNLKDELNKVLSGADVAIDLAFHMPGFAPPAACDPPGAAAAADRPKHRLTYEELQRSIEQVLSDTGYYALQLGSPEDPPPSSIGASAPAPPLGSNSSAPPLPLGTGPSAPPLPLGARPSAPSLPLGIGPSTAPVPPTPDTGVASPPMDRTLIDRSASPSHPYQRYHAHPPLSPSQLSPTQPLFVHAAQHASPWLAPLPTSNPPMTSSLLAHAPSGRGRADTEGGPRGRAETSASCALWGCACGRPSSTPRLARGPAPSAPVASATEAEHERMGGDPGEGGSRHPDLQLGGRRAAATAPVLKENPRAGVARADAGDGATRPDGLARVRAEHGVGGGSAAVRERPPGRHNSSLAAHGLLPKPTGMLSQPKQLPPVIQRPPSIHIPRQP